MKQGFGFLFGCFTALVGCFTAQGQDFAKEFLRNQGDSATCEKVYVAFEGRLLQTNSTIAAMSGFEDLDAETKQDLTAKYQRVLGLVRDSIVLEEFKKEFIRSLQSYGLQVRICNVQDMPTKLRPNEHTINFPQFELEEFVTNDSLVANDIGRRLVYYKLLNGLRFNSWLHYNASDTTSAQMFFADDETTDAFFGFFEREGGQYYANCEIIPINPNDAYLLAHSNAEICARYFFNFLLNRHVWLSTGGNPQRYYAITEEGSLIYDSEPFDNFDVIPQ